MITNGLSTLELVEAIASVGFLGGMLGYAYAALKRDLLRQPVDLGETALRFSVWAGWLAVAFIAFDRTTWI